MTSSSANSKGFFQLCDQRSNARRIEYFRGCMNRRKLQKEKKERKKKMICTWQSSVTRIDSKWRQPWRQDRGITCKNLTGKSPLVLAQGRWSGSKTLVKKASLPSLVHPSHVPPASTSLPPSIFRWPSPHHATGFVGLPSMSIQQQSNLSIFDQ